MSDSTPARDDATPEADEAAEQRLEDELAPEEELLRGLLPDPAPTDGPAPAP
ncbi:hypothetical protein [Agromyces laixinhei]|uniref:hypothetical protein n=1 Tax=Agromyces laixinhei TaxID=2585717 RepID=UPI0012ED5EAA|nr:hypothetical protein [Agromyces laixinhei]